jgi:glycosyltransferase involved in cell wall biosynthesis
VLREIASDYEIIVIDDGSRDGSRDILRRCTTLVPKFRHVFHEKNGGYGEALKSGFREAKMDWVFYTDGDFQYNVEELRDLARAITPSVDVVNGYKVKRHDPWYRIWIGKIYQHIARWMFRLPIRDVDCDFRIMKRPLVQSLNLQRSNGVICIELVKKLHMANARFAEVPVSHLFRSYGTSQFFRVRQLTLVARDILRLWYDLMIRARKNPAFSPVSSTSRE